MTTRSRGDYLPPGLYEEPVTPALAQLIEAVRRAGGQTVEGALDPADSHELLARHLFEVVRRHLRGLSLEERLGRQAEIVNALVAQLGEAEAGLAIPPRVLEAIADATLPSTEPGSLRLDLPGRPDVPLSQSDLLVNARGEPGVGQALAREIPSADRIDLLCAFIRWNGLRVLLPALRTHRERGRALRVITTTYLGSTERRALDALGQLGAEVKVSYETQSTRLHAKAWLMHRESGFSTAYIGSSNLSRTALLDGLEWNVRLSAVTNPDILEKFAATFESYWEDPTFEAYTADRDGERLERELRRASGGERDSGGLDPAAFALLDVRPYPHQREILEQLAVARWRHGHHRNLVVAATGTGKTVVAALDYRDLARRSQTERPGSGKPRLLFVAHRKEILNQSLQTFRAVLRDGAFGELYVDGHRPDEWQHVFASIQSLSRAYDQIRPDHFDVVIVDEFHHAEARTYSQLLDHLTPRELLGLTATPERTDGKNVAEFFGGRIAAEIRLWEALERQILCPFQYFGVHDDVDLSRVQWRRGGYDLSELENVYTGDHARVRLVVQALRDRVSNPLAMRALGFCVSIAHAVFMAGEFNRVGIPSLAVSAESTRDERDDALRALRDRRASVLFAVDLFNEGVDVPEIDTVIFLRPTESATVFLQQLGRGLRHAPEAGKSCLTVLDFIGQAHRHFRFDRRYRALTGTTRAGVRRAVEEGFPHLPAGCSIQLDRVARDVVLENLRTAIGSNRRSLVDELRSLGRDVSLVEFLREADLELEDVYRGWTWTAVRRGAGLPTADEGPDETDLARSIGRILHWDDPARLGTCRGWLEQPSAPLVSGLSTADRRVALGLAFSLWGLKGWSNVQEPLDHLWRNPACLAELRELLALLEERATHITEPIAGVLPDWDQPVPLAIHGRYSLAEIQAAFDLMNLERPTLIREGVKWHEETRSDLFFVTLEKAEKHYSPTTLYKDYAISSRRFHWESQSTTSTVSRTGLRYVHQEREGTNIFLFVRPRRKEGNRTLPYSFLGPARYVSHSGDRPMGIVWELLREMPADLYSEFKLAAGS